jgi:Alw26I/Eco31I/Esp3I family type II restriction m6 adenine DNA methyltransferase
MLNIDNSKKYLQDFDFKSLFVEELGWSNPVNKNPIPFNTKEGTFYRKEVAGLSGAVAFEITSESGVIPDSKVRALVSTEIQKINYEHILIFIDNERTQSLWRWIKKQDKKSLPREHLFSKGQTGDLFISKLAGLFVDISEIENNITITDVAKKIRTALDIEKVTKRFFGDYQQQFVVFLDYIGGIDNEADKRWYASVLLNRLMFIFFLQKKGFVDNCNLDYLYQKYKETKTTFGEDKYYSVFLKKLFFEGFAKPDTERTPETNKLLGNIKYLNGGLFLQHKIELKYPGISIPDIAFEQLLKSVEPKGLFEKYSWSLNDTPGGNDNEINPDVLGYIFEKYINQKAFGAYYTRTEITEYLCEQTVYKLILDEVNEPDIDPELIKKSGLERFGKPKHYGSISELLMNLDASTCKKLIVGESAILPNMSLLDPACGSGAFLVAAMKTLINVYAAIIGKIDFLNDPKLTKWKKEIEHDHPSINYFIKKQIITNNLYGVDIMEEATEIAKLRLFLTLVASAQTVDQLEPLPNIDFNIMAGNSLIGMMRVDPNQFNKQISQDSKRKQGLKTVKEKSLFQPGIVMGNLFAEEHTKSYQQIINEKEAAISAYKNANNLGISDLQKLRDTIREQEEKANEILHNLLLEEFTNLGIKYEQVVWDTAKNKEGKPVKRTVNIDDIKALEPFHWGYEFSEIFRKKDGFDAIITNPPWEIFKPNSKEFFLDYSKVVSRKKMSIKDFEKEQNTILQDDEIKAEWEEYLSNFPHVSLYYRSATQYKNQISIVNGKKAGTDINLYKLFAEQCFNLLKKGGYCGIVIPSGIYTDLGTKQLRQMLFEQTNVTGLFCFENKKEIFEGVHRSFKFVVLSFEKNSKTDSFPAAFMRHDVEELENFPQYGASQISVDFITKQSPDSLSVMEVKNESEFGIVEKMAHFPLLGDDVEGTWKFKINREFDMTNDSRYFKTTPDANTLPLYEGKMIWQFDAHYALPRFWVNEHDARKAFLGKEKDTQQLLDYQNYRLGFRDIASSTNERSVIAAITPKVFHGNKIPQTIIFEEHRIISNIDLVYLCAFFNSYTFDFHIRNRITTTLNFHYVYNTPVPRLNSTHKWYNLIVEKAAKLICTTPEFAELWQDVMKTNWRIEVAATNEEERNTLRAELDSMVAIIYGLNEDEFAYILSTFPIVDLEQKNNALETFRKLSAQTALGNAETLQWQNLINQGESSQLEFKSTLRVDLKTNKPEKFIEHSVLKTLAAFLNSDGGTLLIGVSDTKEVLGLENDFNSFSKPDKLDEFQKHFDNLIAKSIGNHCHHYLKVEFPNLEGKTICAVTITDKSSEPIYITDESGKETFYIRRLASTIDLKPSETAKYIKEHWK